jgi:hypothetical protein
MGGIVLRAKETACGGWARAWERYNPAVRRLPRILLNALTALSLILFAATAALWVRSGWVCDQLWTGRYLVQSEAGGL